MWNKQWRAQTWSEIENEWDLVVIGGGITGAGIFREAAQAGVHVLLVEAHDFAFGTSSRSSKLVHGGFRYLRNKQFDVTFESVTERERLLREAPNLVTPLKFIMTNSKSDHTPHWEYNFGFVLYDLMGRKWKHGHLDIEQLTRIAPQLNREDLAGGFYYYDALVDDARLVFRVIREGCAFGGIALNYAKVNNFLHDSKQQVCGVSVQDTSTSGMNRTAEVKAKVVINASGPWVDTLRANINQFSILRKLRGSHIIFPKEKFPIEQAFTLIHPRDHRYLFAIPWENVVMVGTTDLDHPTALETSQAEPAITPEEVDYLLEATQHTFPNLNLSITDIQSTFAGLRPIVNRGASEPSKESRAHIILEENGLITVAGGKLTTYRLMAHQALKTAVSKLGQAIRLDETRKMLNPLSPISIEAEIPVKQLNRILGRFNNEALHFIQRMTSTGLESIGSTPTLRSEISWALEEEGVEHLDDLMLRRTRLGLLASNGGLDDLEGLRPTIQTTLGWNDIRWETELTAYTQTWNNYYSIPQS